MSDRRRPSRPRCGGHGRGIRGASLLALTMLSTACWIPRSQILLPVAMSVGASSASALIAAEGDGDGVTELGGLAILDSDELDGGGAMTLRGTLVLPGRVGVAIGGRFEAGFVDDRRFSGIAGFNVGAGTRLSSGLLVTTQLGYAWGGYPQSGHNMPLRLQVVTSGALGVRAGVYGAWRGWVDDRYPAAAARFGPGWNAWGVDAAILVGARKGVSLGVNLDRMDDISVISVQLAGSLRGRADAAD